MEFARYFILFWFCLFFTKDCSKFSRSSRTALRALFFFAHSCGILDNFQLWYIF